MTRPLSEKVERLPHVPGEEDDHGNVTESWGEPVEVWVFGFDPGSSSEPREPGGNRVVVEPKLYGPYGMPFTHLDKVVARGQTYTVEGEPARWKHTDGREIGSVVELRKVTG